MHMQMFMHMLMCVYVCMYVDMCTTYIDMCTTHIEMCTTYIDMCIRTLICAYVCILICAPHTHACKLQAELEADRAKAQCAQTISSLRSQSAQVCVCVCVCVSVCLSVSADYKQHTCTAPSVFQHIPRVHTHTHTGNPADNSAGTARAARRATET